MTHWRSAAEKFRSRWIDGSATFTTVASRMTMNCARQTMTRTSHRLTSPDGGGVLGSIGSGRSAARLLDDTGPPGGERTDGGRSCFLGSAPNATKNLSRPSAFGRGAARPRPAARYDLPSTAAVVELV